jgi:hypothetical protein
MSEREGTGLPEGEFADVMAGIDKAAPWLRAISGKGEGAGTPSHHQALLHALKPYLSPARREAADYLLRLWQMGELLKNFTREE